MITKRYIQEMEEAIKLSLSLIEVLHKAKKEVVNPAQLPTWRKASNHYEEPCIGSAFEKTGRRYTALYMGDFYIDLDDLYDKLPKAAYKEGEE